MDCDSFERTTCLQVKHRVKTTDILICKLFNDFIECYCFFSNIIFFSTKMNFYSNKKPHAYAKFFPDFLGFAIVTPFYLLKKKIFLYCMGKMNLHETALKANKTI